jgi:hypothetical protein
MSVDLHIFRWQPVRKNILSHLSHFSPLSHFGLLC